MSYSWRQLEHPVKISLLLQKKSQLTLENSGVHNVKRSIVLICWLFSSYCCLYDTRAGLWTQLHPLAQCNDVANQIYQAMRQSNGSNFFLNRKDTIVINGYLNKKSMSTTLLSVFVWLARLGQAPKGFPRNTCGIVGVESLQTGCTSWCQINSIKH